MNNSKTESAFEKWARIIEEVENFKNSFPVNIRLRIVT